MSLRPICWKAIWLRRTAIVWARTSANPFVILRDAMRKHLRLSNLGESSLPRCLAGIKRMICQIHMCCIHVNPDLLTYRVFIHLVPSLLFQLTPDNFLLQPSFFNTCRLLLIANSRISTIALSILCLPAVDQTVACESCFLANTAVNSFSCLNSLLKLTDFF